MRSEQQSKTGQPNPYYKRLGAKGRARLLKWSVSAIPNVRVLPDDVARAFPDSKATVDALRLVMKLRAKHELARSAKAKARRATKSRQQR